MPPASPRPGGRVAIIGAGISGLVCAHYLQHRYDITVFEAANYIGGHTNTIAVDSPTGPLAIDTGFIVYNEFNYPIFTRLLRELKVESQPTTMSFGMSCRRTGFEYNGSSINQLLARRRNAVSPRFYAVARDILRFHRLTEPGRFDARSNMTVGQYVAKHNLSRAFYDLYLLPIGASLWSSPADRFNEYPIRFVVDFLRNHGMLQLKGRPQWRVIKGGSARYVEKLTAPLESRIRLKTPVDGIQRTDSGVRVSTSKQTAEFDHVILAVHSDQALAMLRDPTPAERDILGPLGYQENIATLHTDEAQLPRRKRAWGGWNYLIEADPSAPVSITYNMNMLQGIDAQTQYCVTLNGADRIDPDKVIRTVRYHHPAYSASSEPARARQAELIGANRTSYCGAYWGHGFHEDGARSAMAVVSHFGCEP